MVTAAQRSRLNRANTRFAHVLRAHTHKRGRDGEERRGRGGWRRGTGGEKGAVTGRRARKERKGGGQGRRDRRGDRKCTSSKTVEVCAPRRCAALHQVAVGTRGSSASVATDGCATSFALQGDGTKVGEKQQVDRGGQGLLFLAILCAHARRFRMPMWRSRSNIASFTCRTHAQAVPFGGRGTKGEERE